MIIMLTLSVVDCGFEPRSGQTKDYNIDICCFSGVDKCMDDDTSPLCVACHNGHLDIVKKTIRQC